MTTLFDPAVITAKRITHQAISPLAVLVRPLEKPGRFEGEIVMSGEPISLIMLDVSEQEAEQPSTIELELGKVADARDGVRLKANRGDFIVVRNTRGGGSYALRSTSSEKGERSPLDTERLLKGDHFAVTLLRPGLWADGKDGVRIRVVHPRRNELSARDALSRKAPRLALDGKTGGEIEVMPGMGVVFDVEFDGASLDLALTEPDDGPDRDKGDLRRAGRTYRRR